MTGDGKTLAPYDDMTGVDPNETVLDVAVGMREFADRIDCLGKRHCDAFAVLLRHYALRIDNARKMELEDVNWKDTCAKCRDGEIEPKFCKFYGEPNGCNSPDPGYHPVDPGANMAEVGNALADLVSAFSNVMGCDVLRFGHDHCDGMRTDGECPNKVNCDRIFNAMRALKSIPRNCDRPFKTLADFQRYYIEHGCGKGLGVVNDGEITKVPWRSRFEEWLLAPQAIRGTK